MPLIYRTFCASSCLKFQKYLSSSKTMSKLIESCLNSSKEADFSP